jgi:hypothetical protein
MDHFCKVWEIVATHMSNGSNIIGYEILNESIGAKAYRKVADVLQPGVSNNNYMLTAYKRIYKTIRAVDQKNYYLLLAKRFGFLE